jgi:haloalkane dehalogenase
VKIELSKKKQRALGIGLGVGLAGAFALAFRYGLRRTPRLPLPEDLSPAIFARRLAPTSHGEMIYHVSGSGDPVLFLHGMYPGASSFEWSRVYPHFVMGREVIAADLVGFGESERPSRRMDASDYADSLADFLQEVCPGRPPVVIASGLTAGLALLTASRHPEKIQSLGLLMPHDSRSAAPWASRRLSAASHVPPLASFLYDFSIAREPFLRTWISRFGYARLERVDEEVVRNLSVCAQQPGARHAMLNVLRGGISLDLSSRLARVPQPVTVLWPELAPGMPVESGLAFSKKLPSSTFALIPDSAALAALENPQTLIRELSPLLLGPSAMEGAA